MFIVFWLSATLFAGQDGAVPAPTAFGPGTEMQTGELKAKTPEDWLRIPISCTYNNATIREVCNDLRTKCPLKVVIDEKALRDENFDWQAGLSFCVENISFKSALNLLLKQADLAYALKDDAIVVTTRKKLKGRLVTRIYPVADLVKIEEINLESIVGQVESMEERLVELVRKTVFSDCWQETGGAGTVTFDCKENLLIVRQTRDVHEEVQDLLHAIRLLTEISVVLKVRWVADPRGPSKFFTPTGDLVRQGMLLDQRQVSRLLSSDRQNCWGLKAEASKKTVLNGQTGTIHLPDVAIAAMKGDWLFHLYAANWVKDDGKISLLPVVSADRQFVRLNLNDALKRDIPNGATLALHGGYLDCGNSRQQVLILITSRIIVRNPEAENIAVREIPDSE